MVNTATINGSVAGTSAALGGVGTVAGINLRNGRVNPGAAGQAGLLTTSAGLAVNTSNAAGATRQMQFDLLGGLVAGSNFDQVSVVGTVNLGTNLAQLVVNTPAGFNANPGDAFVIINNDGTSDLVTGTFIGLPENAPLTVNGQPFRITYRGVNGNDNDVVLIRTNAASMFPNRSITPVVTEGGFATLTGTIGDTDVNDFFILDVNWGDGTATETHVFAPGSPREVSLSHRYLNNPSGLLSGAFPVTLSWRDQNGSSNGDVMSVTVQNANPVVDAGGDITLGLGQPLSRVGTHSDAGLLDTRTATVDYGDGMGAVILALLPDGTFELDHTYAGPGTYWVTVTVTDSDGGVGRDMFQVTV
ncbi:MAG: PKD domain-containing protein, partial [Gemmataceae bacterium]